MKILLKKVIEFLGNNCVDYSSRDGVSLLVTSFALDSRNCKEGSLFFAFDGTKVDGVDFLQDVAKKGVVAAIVPSYYSGDSYGMLLIYVSNPLVALHTLTKEVLKLRKTKIVGITGSVGKTTTKEYLASLLSIKYKVGKTVANYNTEFQIPFALLNADGDEDFFVVEMGMTTKGDITKKVGFAPTDYAIITPIGLAHAEKFSTLAEIASEKGEIILDSTIHAITHHSFLELCSSKSGNIYPTVQFQKELSHLSLPIHFRENLEAAARMAIYLGVDKEKILKQVQENALVDHRFISKKIGTNIIIDDSYNANPLSMRSGIEEVALMTLDKKKVAIVGSMKELGDFSSQAHADIRTRLNSVFDQIFFLGKEWGEGVISYDYLKKLLKKTPLQDSLIFIKGSNSHALWNLLEIL